MGKRVGITIVKVLSAVLTLAVLAGAWIAYEQRQVISDHFAAERFQAPAAVSQLIDRLPFTEAGERVFRATHPTLDSSQRFNVHCSNVDHSDEGHVLGCYSGGGIHLFEVTDDRLQGIVEVTASHELMHAVFARMSDDQRSQMVDQLTRVYEELLTAYPALEERMSVYSALSPTGFANELHSVLATEVRDLPNWLEVTYAEWFTDRMQVLDFYDAYREIFGELQKRADELGEQMADLRADIERRSDEYDAAVSQFNADTADFRARNEAYEFSSNRAEFDRIYDNLQWRRQSLESDLASLEDDIARYDVMREEMLALSETNSELDQHLNSDLAPPSAAVTGD